MTSSRKLLAVACTALALTIGTASVRAQAETQWERNHPRRDQVSDRLQNQNKQIKQEVREGEMSNGRAARLHAQDRKIRREERAMASMNGGHITKTEQATLNQQENKVSREIGK